MHTPHTPMYTLARKLVHLFVHIFYPKLSVEGVANRHSSGPLIIVANHPNTLMDPIVIGSVYPQPLAYVAKALIFQNPVVAFFLRRLNVIPIHRAQDSKPGQPLDNTAAFAACSAHLAKGGSILIFPEGQSTIEFKLRPMKSGTARIALDFEKERGFTGGLCIQPVGLNYMDASRFGTRLGIQFGPVLKMAVYKDSYDQDAIECVRQLTTDITTALSELMILADNSEEEVLIQRLRAIYLREFEDEQQRLAAMDQLKTLSHRLKEIKSDNPVLYAQLRSECSAYFDLLDDFDMPVALFRRRNSATALWGQFIGLAILLILGLPIYISGLLLNWLPYKLPYYIAKAITPAIQFRSGIMLLSGVVLFAFWYSALILIGYQNLSDDAWIFISYVISLPLSGLFVLRYYKLAKFTIALVRYRSLVRSRQDVVARLQRDAVRLRGLVETLVK